ncbi:MAG TPA: glycoside hydrolase family 88 protein [Chitinophagales bacterium]|nr:glycoside hydrolase family 88 protein [Chitinophagales bacterium]
MKNKILLSILALSLSLSTLQAKTWVDSLDIYVREKYMPPSKFKWTWQRASLLFAATKQYEFRPEDQKSTYLNYVQKAIDKRYGRANGKSPNAVASGLGMSFLSMHNMGEKYDKGSNKIYQDYLKVKRTDNGGISHKRHFKELWDDTVFMIGIYLQNMYNWTGDEKYIDQMFLQYIAHREKLMDPATGLWVHGWDGDNRNRCNFCGQSGWSKNESKRSNELWGRGNGWVIVTIAELVQLLSQDHPRRAEAEGYLKEMIINLPGVQDKISGHWYQLPMRPDQPGNYIESSATAMFAYGILIALQEGVVNGSAYEQAIQNAYQGLRTHSVKSAGGAYLTVTNTCKGTCIGNMDYYLNRKAKAEKPSGLGMVLLFGSAYEDYISKTIN